MPRDAREHPTLRLDLDRTFGYLRMGRHDPTCVVTPTTFTKTVAVDEREVVRHTLEAVPGGGVRVTVEGDAPAPHAAAWGAQLAAAAMDGHDAFTARREHLPLRYLVHELVGLRFVRVPWLFDAACGIVLQQRVTYEEALGAYRAIALRHGAATPLGHAFPAAARLARVAPAELQALGIDPRRATTLIRVAREHALHGLLDAADRAALAARLGALPGVGPWTTGMLLAYAAGDPDAVPVGDLHLPHIVTQVLAGERRGTDERMLALLAPYAGQRARVCRLILHAKVRTPALLRRR